MLPGPGENRDRAAQACSEPSLPAKGQLLISLNRLMAG
jgi:hypothetical protein